jgi:subtilase family serine protease
VPVVLSVQLSLNAYPVSALSSGDNPVSPLATNGTFLAAKVHVGQDGRVLSMPVDWTTQQVLGMEESGVPAHGYSVSVQRGFAVVALTGTPAASAARRPAMAAPAAPVSRPSTQPIAKSGATATRIATVQPAGQVMVHGYSSTGQPQLTQATPSGYDPATMRAYLGLHGTGAGQTIAIVDVYGDPAITSDVNTFSAQFGLPGVCTGTTTTGCFQFTVTAPDGTGAVDSGWGLETTLDVEWAHAIAPQASIQLVEAKDGMFSSLYSAIHAAAALKPDTISLSWGFPEEFTDETYYDSACQLTSSLCVASTGDQGYPGEYPAYNPAVLAVGGTSLNLAADGSVTGETAWSGSGGGQSYVEPTPAYQQGVVTGGRGIPDVSFDADPATGVPIYDSTPYGDQSGWFQVGGTSFGAPAWSALIASADQLRTAAGKSRLTSADGSAHQAIYASAGQLADVTGGPRNGFCPLLCTAGPGYDFVTGLGSPRAGFDATLAAVR